MSDSEGEVRRKCVSLARLHCGHSHRISSLLCSIYAVFTLISPPPLHEVAMGEASVSYSEAGDNYF